MFIARARLTKTVYIGNVCTGTDGATNRTLVCTRPLLSDSLVINGRAVLISGAGKDYTTSGATITFLIPVFDTDQIMVLA